MVCCLLSAFLEEVVRDWVVLWEVRVWSIKPSILFDTVPSVSPIIVNFKCPLFGTCGHCPSSDFTWMFLLLPPLVRQGRRWRRPSEILVYVETRWFPVPHPKRKRDLVTADVTFEPFWLDNTAGWSQQKMEHSSLKDILYVFSNNIELHWGS